MSWTWTFNIVTMLLLVAASLRWGAGPERICAAVIAAMDVGDRIYHLVVGRGTIYASVDVGHLVSDLLAAAIFITVALRANRVYPLWLSAFQLVSVVSHFARQMDSKVGILAYAVMNYAPYNLILLTLAGGIWAHARRETRYGPYRSWRTSSNPSRAASPKSPPTG
jgi:hypothetical protein